MQKKLESQLLEPKKTLVTGLVIISYFRLVKFM